MVHHWFSACQNLYCSQPLTDILERGREVTAVCHQQPDAAEQSTVVGSTCQGFLGLRCKSGLSWVCRKPRQNLESFLPVATQREAYPFQAIGIFLASRWSHHGSVFSCIYTSEGSYMSYCWGGCQAQPPLNSPPAKPVGQE